MPARRVRCSAAPEDESTFGKPAAPRELWEGFARRFRSDFLAEAAKPDAEGDVARAALLLAAEDDAVATRTAVPLPVEAYLERLDNRVQDFVVAFGDAEVDDAARLGLLDAYLYGEDACRFRVPTAWAEKHSPYRTCVR